MENREKSKLNKLKVTSLALTSMILMGSGIGNAKAIASDGSDLPNSTKETIETTQSPVVVPTSTSYVEENAQVFDKNEIWDSMENYKEIDNLMVYELFIDGQEHQMIVCRALELGETEGDRIYREYISYQPIFEIKYNGDEKYLIGLGPLEGKKIDFVTSYGLEQYFEEALKRKLEWPETMGELKSYIESIPELRDNYLVLPLNLEELMGANTVKLEYFSNTTMEYDDENKTLRYVMKS